MRPGQIVVVMAAYCLLVSCAMQPTGSVTNPYPPVPALMPETVPNPPVTADQLIWQPGHWDWLDNSYVWSDGQYVPAEGHGNLWMPGWWSRLPSGWVWQPPHWTLSTKASESDFKGALVAALSMIPESHRENVAQRYIDASASKALAIAPERHGSWRRTGLPNPTIAEQATLEGCQIMYGSACFILARADHIVPITEQDEQSRVDMPRLHYDGPFDPAQIPVVSEQVRSSSTVTNYAGASGPKAMAIHPWGIVFAVTGAASQTVAEEQVLQQCNADPYRKSDGGPCYLYAISNQVVLPQRVSQP